MSSFILVSTSGKNFFRNESIEVTPPSYIVIQWFNIINKSDNNLNNFLYYNPDPVNGWSTRSSKHFLYFLDRLWNLGYQLIQSVGLPSHWNVNLCVYLFFFTISVWNQLSDSIIGSTTTTIIITIWKKFNYKIGCSLKLQS